MSRRLRYLGLIFDMDGTLTLPQNYMFKRMRDALGIDKSQDILGHIKSIQDTTKQQAAHQKIEQIERDAMKDMKIQPGLETLMSFLREHPGPIVRGDIGRATNTDGTAAGSSVSPVQAADSAQSHGVRIAICTRNFQEPVKHLLSTFLSADRDRIYPVLTREYEPPKPSAEPLLYILRQWGLSPKDCCMIGDGADDLKAGKAAGLDTRARQ
ncbi:hypothetical protein PYCC9005_001441 [Savitreella phatthalungensis]